MMMMIVYTSAAYPLEEDNDEDDKDDKDDENDNIL